MHRPSRELRKGERILLFPHLPPLSGVVVLTLYPTIFMICQRILVHPDERMEPQCGLKRTKTRSYDPLNAQIFFHKNAKAPMINEVSHTKTWKKTGSI